MATALFLLHKSTKATCSSEEFRAIWHKVDTSHSGVLDAAGIKQVLALTGAQMSDERVASMCTKDFGARMSADGVSLEVHADDFERKMASSAPTAALGTAIFFVQSFSLLVKDVSIFSSAGALDLDAEQVLGECISPLSYTERFVTKTVLTPLVLFGGLVMMVPVWNMLRRKLPQEAWEKLQAPPQIERVHFQRGALNAFLFCFAPLTRSAVQTMVCVEPCSEKGSNAHHDGEACDAVLAFDRGVKCWEGEHLTAAFVAVSVLAGVAVIIPALLLRRVHRSKKRRDASLELRPGDVDTWFAELDVDKSGALEDNEIEVLLKRMGEAIDGGTMATAMQELDPDGSGSVSKAEFEQWFHGEVTGLMQTPFDVLFGQVHSHAWWWFMEVLWVKTAINALFTFGYFGSFDWTVWMAMVMMMSVILLVLRQPYISDVDKEVELFALLSLAGVSHVVSIFESGTPWEQQRDSYAVYVALAVVLFLVPVATFAHGTLKIKRSAKRDTETSDSYRAWFGKTTAPALAEEPTAKKGSGGVHVHQDASFHDSLETVSLDEDPEAK